MKQKYIWGEIFSLVLGILFLVPLVHASLDESVKILETVPDHVWGVLVVRNLHETSQMFDGYCRTLDIEPLKFERAWIRKLGLESVMATDQHTVLIVLEPTVETPQPFVLGFSVHDQSSLSASLNICSTQSSGIMEGSSQELGRCFWIQKESHVLLSPSSVVLNRLFRHWNDPFGDITKVMEQKKYDAFIFLDRAIYLHWTQQGGNKNIPTTSMPQDFSRADHNSLRGIALGLRLSSKGIDVAMDIAILPETMPQWNKLSPEAYESILVTIPRTILEILFQKPMSSLSEAFRMSSLQIYSNAKNTIQVSTTLSIEGTPEVIADGLSGEALPDFKTVPDSQKAPTRVVSWFSRWGWLLSIVAMTLGAGFIYRTIIAKNIHVNKEF